MAREFHSFPIPPQISYQFCFLKTDEPRQRVVQELDRSVLLTPEINSMGEPTWSVLDYLSYRYGGEFMDYEISELPQGRFLVRLPDWVSPQRVMQETRQMREALNMQPEHWTRALSRQRFNQYYRVHIGIYNFPIDYWDVAYFNRAVSSFGNLYSVSTENLNGANKHTLELTVWTPTLHMIPAYLILGQDEAWSVCEIQIRGWSTMHGTHFFPPPVPPEQRVSLPVTGFNIDPRRYWGPCGTQAAANMAIPTATAVPIVSRSSSQLEQARQTVDRGKRRRVQDVDGEPSPPKEEGEYKRMWDPQKHASADETARAGDHMGASFTVGSISISPTDTIKVGSIPVISTRVHHSSSWQGGNSGLLTKRNPLESRASSNMHAGKEPSTQSNKGSRYSRCPQSPYGKQQKPQILNRPLNAKSNTTLNSKEESILGPPRRVQLTQQDATLLR